MRRSLQSASTIIARTIWNHLTRFELKSLHTHLKMNGIYFLTIALVAMTATAAPPKTEPSSAEKNEMGVIPGENYENFLPKMQQQYIEFLLRERRDAAGDGLGESSLNSYQGNYKKFMPHLEQLFMEKFAPSFASGKKTESKE